MTNKVHIGITKSDLGRGVGYFTCFEKNILSHVWRTTVLYERASHL